MAHIMSDNKNDNEVLYNIPATKSWIGKFILVLHLTGQSSYRCINQAAQLLLDTRLSLDKIHNTIVKNDASIARIYEF